MAPNLKGLDDALMDIINTSVGINGMNKQSMMDLAEKSLVVFNRASGNRLDLTKINITGIVTISRVSFTYSDICKLIMVSWVLMLV